MMNKSGFVLIEIIISVMLLSFAGIALLKVNSNQKKYYSIAQNKLKFAQKISIVSNRHSIDLHNKKLNLYDMVKKEYNLKNDELITILKDSEVNYKQKEKATITLQVDEETAPLIISVDEITVSNRQGTSKYIMVKK